MLRQILRQGLKTNTTILRLSSNAAKGGQTSPGSPPTGATGASSAVSKDAFEKIVKTNKVVIFMKGNPEAPLCGFSNAVVQILRMHGVQYDAHDVLQSDELRQGIKAFTDWPTIPQVFINGEFIGGCDILLQMHQNGDLIEELQKAGIESALLKQANEKSNSEKNTKDSK